MIQQSAVCYNTLEVCTFLLNIWADFAFLGQLSKAIQLDDQNLGWELQEMVCCSWFHSVMVNVQKYACFRLLAQSSSLWPSVLSLWPFVRLLFQAWRQSFGWLVTTFRWQSILLKSREICPCPSHPLNNLRLNFSSWTKYGWSVKT